MLTISLIRFVTRSDTPLIYKAVPSWFIRVEDIVDDLLKNNAKCYWYVPNDNMVITL